LVILAASFFAIQVAVTAYSTSSDDLELLIPSFVVSLLNQVRPVCIFTVPVAW
jgi:hypothetical protein